MPPFYSKEKLKQTSSVITLVKRGPEFKAFAYHKINVIEKMKLALERVENIMGKGENAGYQHFLLCPQCFQKPCFSWLLNVGIVW